MGKNEKNEKCLKLPDLVRKLIRKTLKHILPPPQTCVAKNFRWYQWGAEQSVKRAQTQERGLFKILTPPHFFLVLCGRNAMGWNCQTLQG